MQRFGADGVHATQALTGTIEGGTGAFRAARSTVAGGGKNVENPPGTIVSAHLRYRLRLRPGTPAR